MYYMNKRNEETMSKNKLLQPIYEVNQDVIWKGSKFKIKRVSPNETIHNENGVTNYLENLYLLTNEKQDEVWVSENSIKDASWTDLGNKLLTYEEWKEISNPFNK